MADTAIAYLVNIESLIDKTLDHVSLEPYDDFSMFVYYDGKFQGDFFAINKLNINTIRYAIQETEQMPDNFTGRAKLTVPEYGIVTINITMVNGEEHEITLYIAGTSYQLTRDIANTLCTKLIQP